MNGHTLLLFQKDNSPDSRTWTEHENITLAVEAIIAMYETRLAESHPTRGHIHYQVGDLIGFISQCREFAALVAEKEIIENSSEWNVLRQNRQTNEILHIQSERTSLRSGRYTKNIR
ncbi:enhancer of rudimentary homolog [Rhizophagus clarus]|uniref:Enhancer of rudimentary homolog n=1 Tax=Rhizophagus clarus TaxID=94130 RepID=A0A8H3QTG2_9GLOM|nr:enhancer of rudimentary homolog [Rhizophagus clarus]